MAETDPGTTDAPSAASAPPESADVSAAPESAAPDASTSQNDTAPGVDSAERLRGSAAADVRLASTLGVSWTASEFIAHEKSTGWYVNLGVGAVVVAALIFLLTHDLITTGVILFAALLLGIVARRSPKELDYQIDNSGIRIGAKHYPFDQFRSFAIVPEGAFSGLELVPLKRFSPLLTVYYAPEHEEAIISIISKWLPVEESRRDPVDSLMQRIRF